MTHSEFTLLREEAMNEVGGIARLWKHNRTGAELMSICNSDENKSFGVAFRTPPKNSTGVAHILEHSVLCGSAKYPVKEPFVELLKSSLQTFLNALTFPDKTCYPVASTNLQDFYNLIDVYLDAVFYPRIDEQVLAQEGWHIHVNEDGSWDFKGVVFNEMKGVYSSPDSVLGEESQHAVFPDTLYSLDSGGDPEQILTLSYEEFKDFHSRYYHPSNARFFFWGDDPEDTRLDLLAKTLAGFEKVMVDSAVPLQKRLQSERTWEAGYVAEEGDNKAHVTVNWLLCEGREAEEVMVLSMLEHILTGLPGSPLRKALMDSGLGEDISGCGLETDLQQAYFSIGLRSVLPENAGSVETLVLDTLAELVETGISDKAVEGAVSSLEFVLRENNTGSYPRGLMAMFQSLSTWLYDGDPFLPLAWEAPLASIKKRLADGEKIFEKAIQDWFLENSHRVNVILLPDENLEEERQNREDARLNKIREALSEEEVQEVAQMSASLMEAQQKPDSPEALATIPNLELKDLPLKGKILPFECVQEKPEILHHEVDSTGILYARLLLPLNAVPQPLYPLLPLFSRALTEMGTARHDFVELGLEISAQTGGIGAGPIINASYFQPEPLCYFQISGKAVQEKIPALADLMREVLTETNFDSKERFAQMVLEEKARLEQGIIPSGHAVLGSALDGMLSPSGYLGGILGGIPYLEYVRALLEMVEQDYAAIREQLLTLRTCIVRNNGHILSLTGDEALLGASSVLKEMAGSLPDNPASAEKLLYDLKPVLPGQAYLVPAQVNYVGMGANLNATGYQYHGSTAVIMRFLRMGYLWDRVRVQGGAYGAFVRYARATGILLFLSYRDPNVSRTLDIYRNAADYLGNLSLSQEELVKSIVGSIGDIDTYLLPSDKGKNALWEHLTGYTQEMRQQNREEILGTSLHDFHDFAPWLQKALDNALPAALGGQAVAEYAQQQSWNSLKLL